jgi:hypothetical protein
MAATGVVEPPDVPVPESVELAEDDELLGAEAAGSVVPDVGVCPAAVFCPVLPVVPVALGLLEPPPPPHAARTLDIRTTKKAWRLINMDTSTAL